MTTPTNRLTTAARVVTDLGRMAQIGWVGPNTFAPRNSPRTEWIALMSPALFSPLAATLVSAADEITEGLRLGMPPGAVPALYGPVLELAEVIIRQAPVMPL